MSTVSPRPAKPALRTALVEAAARIVANEGVTDLTLRRVAEEVGTSTMAIYTYFGGMSGLRRAVRHEGFARLADHLAQVSTSDDPVADISMIGLAYYVNGISNPDLYRVMFIEQPLDAEDARVGMNTFHTLVAAAERCIEAGRFGPGDPIDIATELWAITHAFVTLQLAGLLPPSEALDRYASAGRHLLIGLGDDPAAVDRAHASARRHLEVAAPAAARG